MVLKQMTSMKLASNCFARDSHQFPLPPTKDALRKHIDRSNYQAALWKYALTPEVQIPSPDGHGWVISDHSLIIVWKEQDATPKALVEYTRCSCKTSCHTRRCSCRAAGLVCTNVCHCINCENISNEIDQTYEYYADEGESDEEFRFFMIMLFPNFN